MQTENWTQGNWNAFVVFECTVQESRKRCREVPDQFRDAAISHASTYWKLQGHVRPTRKRAPPKPHQPWPLIEITPEHWEKGKAHLDGADWQHLVKFGDQVLGFAAEYAVADWFDSIGVKHNHSDDPRGTAPDYTINGKTVDLKSVSTKGQPRSHYEAPLAERQRKQDEGKIDWYLFGKYDNTTDGDFYVIGFQTAGFILEHGLYYVQGETTRRGMEAPVDCWCVEYQQLMKPSDWLEIFNGQTQPREP